MKDVYVITGKTRQKITLIMGIFSSRTAAETYVLSFEDPSFENLTILKYKMNSTEILSETEYNQKISYKDHHFFDEKEFPRKHD